MDMDHNLIAQAVRLTGGVLVLLAVLGGESWAAQLTAAGVRDPAEREDADLVIISAKIWTGAQPPDPRAGRPDAVSALAVRGGTIVRLGDDGSVRPLIGPETHVIDAQRRRVLPGMTDSHTHITSGGLQLTRLALRHVRSREEFIRSVEAEAKTKKKGEWVLGGRWSVESWADPKPPNKGWLDPVTGDTPVYLSRMDGHQALVNTAALRLAGIDTSGPKDPKGGEIQRDPRTGEPTGILKESAMDLVSDLIPEPTTNERYEALRRAMRHANSLGVTSVHDMSVPADLEVFRRAHDDGTLTLRITTYFMVDDWASSFDVVERFPIRDDMFRIAGFKGFMDGSLGSRTAYMREPYSDAPPESPYPRGQLTAQAADTESFRESVAIIDARGWQSAVHAIGDEANHLLLDAYEAALKRNKHRDARHRVEHAQHLHVEDIPRFGRLGVVASMQPFHKADDGRYAERRLGPKRLEGSYAYRRLLDTGALVCFGSDWPVVTISPFAGIDSAVNARTLAGNVWLPSHSITLEEAVRAYTVSPPLAIHRADRLGSLEVGKLADILILADDPFSIPRDKLGEVKVDMTIVAGRIVYTRPGSVFREPPPSAPLGRSQGTRDEGTEAHPGAPGWMGHPPVVKRTF